MESAVVSVLGGQKYLGNEYRVFQTLTNLYAKDSGGNPSLMPKRP